MATSSHVAQVVIQAQTTGVAQALKQVQGGVYGVKAATDAAGKSNDQFNKTLDNIEKKMSGFKGSIDKIAGVLGGAGLVGMAMGAASAFGEMTKRALEITGANQALKISLDEAKKATMGLVDNQTLTLAANKATQLGVVKTDKEFANLAKTASKLGLAMGQDAAKSVDDLTVALGRQSFEILDNLGIILKVSEANETYAKRIGKLATELTDAEKKQAFMTIGLEKAIEAADRSGVSLDNQAARLQKAAATWTNFKDEVATTTTTIAAGTINTFEYLGESLGKSAYALVKTNESMFDFHQIVQMTARDVEKETQALIANAEARMEMEEAAKKKAPNGVYEMTDQEKAFTERMQRDQKAELEAVQYEAFLNSQKMGPELPPAKKAAGKKKQEQKEIVNVDRNATAIAIGEEASYQIQEVKNSQDYIEAVELEIQAREDKIQAIEFEMEYQVENTDLQVELASKKYRAEQELLDFQIAAATTREEILELETQKRKKTTLESQRIMLQAQKIEQQDIKKREAVYEKFAKVHEDLANVMVNAAWDAAEGQKGAMAMALGEYLKGVSKQMAVKAAVELALGAAALAGVVSAGLAPGHFIAAGMAAAAAVAAGGAGVALSAVGNARADSDKDTSSDPTSVSTDPGMSGSGKGKGGNSSEKGDEDGVPTSYYDGGLYSKKPDRSGGSTASMKNSSSITINASVLGATSDQVGIAIQRILNTGKRSLGNVK